MNLPERPSFGHRRRVGWICNNANRTVVYICFCPSCTSLNDDEAERAAEVIRSALEREFTSPRIVDEENERSERHE